VDRILIHSIKKSALTMNAWLTLGKTLYFDACLATSKILSTEKCSDFAKWGHFYAPVFTNAMPPSPEFPVKGCEKQANSLDIYRKYQPVVFRL